MAMREIERWRFCLGRHIKELAGFTVQRTCDRRLAILIEGGYIERKKVLYGIPGMYNLTHKGKMLIGVNKRQEKIRVERVSHDIGVLDTAIYFMKKEQLKLEDITTEKQMYSMSGFGQRKHFPDFVFEKEGLKICVEVELTPKLPQTFEKNVGDNYLTYDEQYWVVPKSGAKIRQMLEKICDKYPNIKTLELEEVRGNDPD
ncbi:MAG: replication-relaxation family protein [Firmicutes bacterium]|nr:replication-relaxation family protein [Bacillota bacterium]